MSDYLRSAFGYLNGGTAGNDYVGQTLEINNVRLRVTRLIAEGESISPAASTACQIAIRRKRHLLPTASAILFGPRRSKRRADTPLDETRLVDAPARFLTLLSAVMCGLTRGQAPNAPSVLRTIRTGLCLWSLSDVGAGRFSFSSE